MDSATGHVPLSLTLLHARARSCTHIHAYTRKHMLTLAHTALPCTAQLLLTPPRESGTHGKTPCPHPWAENRPTFTVLTKVKRRAMEAVQTEDLQPQQDP